MTIYSKLEPFTSTQVIYVMDKAEIVEEKKVDSISEFYEIITELSKKYNADSVKICGNKSYLSKMALTLKTKFECNCPIEIV